MKPCWFAVGDCCSGVPTGLGSARPGRRRAYERRAPDRNREASHREYAFCYYAVNDERFCWPGFCCSRGGRYAWLDFRLATPAGRRAARPTTRRSGIAISSLLILQADSSPVNSGVLTKYDEPMVSHNLNPFSRAFTPFHPA